jgi:polar amino acid transport system substrate-binding protein
MGSQHFVHTGLVNRFLVAALTVLTACDDSAPTQGQTLAAIQSRKQITWGADLQGGEPYVYEDPKDPSKRVGFEVDLMDAIGRRLGVTPVFVQNQWSNLVPGLERGDFDIIMNGLEATAERKERLLLSEPYYVYAETLTIRAGDPYRSVFDLVGKKVGTLNQTYAWDMLKAIGNDPIPYEGNEEPYIDLQQGRIDAVLLDNIIADRYGCMRAKLVCIPYDQARGTYVVGMRKGDTALKAEIDRVLADMREDGELEKILAKHELWDGRQVDVIPTFGTTQRRTFDGPMLAQFARAAVVTLEVSLLAFLLAVPLGLVLAIGRVYGALPVRVLARGYIELFRGTPVLLQLFVIYYGLPAFGVRMGPLEAAILGLGMNYAAYEAEVYRGALLAIPRGQAEAARALGMSPVQSLRHVLVPQALRLALPAMTNDFVALLKDSSLVSVIAVIELTKRMTIAAVDVRSWILPGLVCAAFYLVLSFPLSELARRLERRLARDQRPHAL